MKRLLRFLLFFLIPPALVILVLGAILGIILWLSTFEFMATWGVFIGGALFCLMSLGMLCALIWDLAKMAWKESKYDE